MGVLFSTGRNPSDSARNLCKAFASVIPDSACEWRGAKTVDCLAARARLLGKKRLAVIHSGKTTGLHFARVTGSSWDWVGAPVLVKEVKFNASPSTPPCCMAFSGKHASAWEKYLGAPLGGDCGCDGVVADCGEDCVSFRAFGRKAGPELVLA